MGLAELQGVLARLFTDSAFREHFLRESRNPDSDLMCRLGLSETDLAQLARLSHPQLNLFAGTLQQKRYQAVCKLLPRSHAQLGPRFKAQFQDFAQGYLPGGTQKHVFDALQFAKYLASKLQGAQVRRKAEAIADENVDANVDANVDEKVDEKVDVWLLELIRYEAICLETRVGNRFWLLERFRFRVWEADLIPGSLTLCLWLRFGRHRPWWHLRLPLPWTGRARSDRASH